MKKILYTVMLLAAGNAVYAQGFLKKVKAKVAQAVAQPVAAQEPAGIGSGVVTNTSWINPAVCGTVVATFSQKELNDHMGTFDLWFPYVKVVNNQLQLQVADYSSVLYDYTNGKLVKAGIPPSVDRNALKNGNEYELRSIDFTQLDQQNAMMKTGLHVSSGMIPGKPMQTLTFKGKPVGNGFMMFQIAHNADSSVVAVAGASISGGLKYSLVTSTGQALALPAKPGALPLVSPDGKFSAAWVGQDNLVYLSNGTIAKTTAGVFPDKLWLRNTGNVFCMIDNHTSTLYKNGEVYRAFNMQMTPKQIFISKDDKSMCWEGDHGLYFSDGTAFENGTGPHKVVIDGKEVIVFMAVNLTSGQLYLCKKEL